MTIRSKQQMRDLLDQMIETGVVRQYEIQSLMPGLRWTIVTHSQGTGNVYTSAQLDNWFDGAIAVATYAETPSGRIQRFLLRNERETA